MHWRLQGFCITLVSHDGFQTSCDVKKSCYNVHIKLRFNVSTEMNVKTALPIYHSVQWSWNIQVKIQQAKHIFEWRGTLKSLRRIFSFPKDLIFMIEWVYSSSKFMEVSQFLHIPYDRCKYKSASENWEQDFHFLSTLNISHSMSPLHVYDVSFILSYPKQRGQLLNYKQQGCQASDSCWDCVSTFASMKSLYISEESHFSVMFVAIKTDMTKNWT